MINEWQSRLRVSLQAPIARRERQLFHELNPARDYSPILKAPPTEPRPAAVMIGVRDIVDPTVVLTLRSPSMPSHAGQISLPGGTPKPTDADFVATALRESEEEVGLAADAFDVLGTMGPHHGGLGYVVTPVIGIIHGEAEVEACPREVAEVFEVPLASLLNPENHIIQKRQFNDIPYDMFAVPVYDTQGEHRNIWGLTAGILKTLSDAYHDT
ncbi:MAG: CoA pyrophosphatase [Parvularculaceae bacterium]|nr:CoA pyrophosphatase [Parvularculaceae bacterium]